MVEPPCRVTVRNFSLTYTLSRWRWGRGHPAIIEWSDDWQKTGATILETAVGLRTGDLVTLIIYFVLMIGIGFWCSRRLDSTEGYFVGGRKVPGWAIAFSMLGTSISSVTFLAYPGSAYETNWSLLVPGLMLPIAAVFAVIVFVPFFRKTQAISVYEYLERRYGTWARIYGCVMWSAHSFFRMGVILLLLSLPLSSMMNVDFRTIIIITGILVTIYTVVGGIEAVIWTDVLQTIILLLGGIICVFIVSLDLPGGLSTVFRDGMANHKFYLSIDYSFDLTKETLLVLVLFGLFQNLQEFVSDQTKIQRYCAAASDREAKRATLLSGLACIPVWMVFMLVGTCLWVYYQHFPEAVVQTLKSDQVFPHFIVTQLPSGLAGFVVAAIIAAAMSSIDSSMNGVATVITTDLYKQHFVKNRSDRHYLNAARIITAFAGCLMIVWAMLLSRIETAILPKAFAIYAVLAGGLGGMYFLGLFTTRTNNQGLLFGIVSAIAVTVWMSLSELRYLPAWLSSPFHQFMINVFTNVVAFILGYFVSYLFPKPRREQLAGLTVWTYEEKNTVD